MLPRGVEEPAPYIALPDGPPPLDFSANSDAVRIVVESEQLSYGYLANPTFATEISLIDPLPHQRLAVYDHMLPRPRLRFLLADDAGAGKTIMSGLYIREMLMRRLIRRVLIVPPAGLVGNWKRELETLFALSFRIVAGAEARTANPFIGAESDLLVVSLDTLSGEKMFGRLQEEAVEPYDLVIFDEAHKLSASREADLSIRKTARYELGEALAGVEADDPRWLLSWRAQHLLLLTATPHMGADYPYYCLWRLLEPEALATYEAFERYPREARAHHFIRRTKEEMVRLDGSPLYPRRDSSTMSYALAQGAESEQELYDQTTDYIQFQYNRARGLNRSAAQLAMSVFQRRLASSTYAVLRSFERRAGRLDALIADVRAGRKNPAALAEQHALLERAEDILERALADDDRSEDGREDFERAEDDALSAIDATSLADLEQERGHVARLIALARRVEEKGQESKFATLREVLHRPEGQGEKMIVFTEHRDTLTFLRRRLENLGYTGQVATIHGGMDYREREEQVRLFHLPPDEGGATYLLATDAAGEGINLQFCWRMLNYDIPWNPARLEQRMGRIHRYGQKHDPVVIVNLVAGATREGKVLKTLLEKLENIRVQLHSDKVFDVIGRLFQNVSLRDYMSRVGQGEDADAVGKELAGTLTKEQVLALAERERTLYGPGGEVKAALPRLREELARESFRTVLPGYVRRFIGRAAPLLEIEITGDLGDRFAFRPAVAGALDPLWPPLERYPAEQRAWLTAERPEHPASAVFLHPGEPVFEQLCGLVALRYAREALRGAVFIDPTADRPYFFHLVQVAIRRRADPAYPRLARDELLGWRLAGLLQDSQGSLHLRAVEQLLLLHGADRVPPDAIPFASTILQALSLARAFAQASIAAPIAEQFRATLLADLDERLEFVRHGFARQYTDLATARRRFAEKARAGDARARGELTKITYRQTAFAARKDAALAALRREPELIVADEVVFLAHALVVPSFDPEERALFDAQTEEVAVAVAQAYEQALGAWVRNVSTPEKARAAGLADWPGFDLLSHRPDGRELAIEVKGRANHGVVELSENEYARAANMRERYWLYVVFGCAGPTPSLVRIQDPFHKLLFRFRGSVQISEQDIVAAADVE